MMFSKGRMCFVRRSAKFAVGCILGCALGLAGDPTSVPSANPKSPGKVAPDILSVELIETPVAQGSMPVENPSALVGFYGYTNDGPMIPAPGDLPTATHKVEASKTEPDKTTYLVLPPQKGPDVHYSYGTHFLFQGHETGQT